MILSKPIKNIQAATIHNAFLNIHNILKPIVNDPKVYIIENECSSEFKEYIKKYNIDFHIAPPNMHRQNATEQAVQTCKNNFIAGFSNTDTYFLISGWNRLVF